MPTQPRYAAHHIAGLYKIIQVIDLSPTFNLNEVVALYKLRDG